MQQQFIDLLNNFNKVSMDTTKELMTINSRAFEQFSQKQVELVNDYMATSLKQFEAMREIKDPKDVQTFIDSQTAEMQKCTEKLCSTTKETMETMAQSTDELNTWMKKGMDTIASNLKSVSDKKVT